MRIVPRPTSVNETIQLQLELAKSALPTDLLWDSVDRKHIIIGTDAEKDAYFQGVMDCSRVLDGI